jgi:hypothetical protein
MTSRRTEQRAGYFLGTSQFVGKASLPIKGWSAPKNAALNLLSADDIPAHDFV